ncbi:tetratricopeptide repeat protein [Pelagicoccus sp. SDUM812005]|uniref:tetratricopeptide repeat protein n=1 Tax=Pelagicoccus sp. SDUM812005 TaxID=3041257 RepID=UPI00280F1386|nr:tetratricopeptide repeat protein [Pelagicoccus sp. SDUM812005]MDQ8182386.1 tetratricopeptide repeat protein [Pelagicoccus sp. SDUM812005]
MNTRSYLKTLAISAGLLTSSLHAQVYDLTEQSFDNPEFRAYFAESYVAKSETNPNITAEEKGLFDEIVPLIGSDPKAAIARLESSVGPDSSAAFDYILGNLYYQEGQTKKSVASYQTAIKKFPNYAQAYYNMGRAFVAENDYQNALKGLQKSLSIETGDGTMYGLIGYCYLNMDMPSTALDAYKVAIMLAPDSKDWKLGQLQCLIALERSQEAIGLLYEFIKAEPNKADWWKLQANQFLAVNERSKAAANLTVVKDLGKADGPSLALLGDLFVNEGLVEPAVDSYTEAMKLGGARPARIIEVVNSLIYMDQLGNAKTLLSNLESVMSAQLTESQEMSVLNVKARLAMQEDDTDGAAGFLATLVKKDPLNGGALLSLSELEKKRGDLAKAEYYAENATKLKGYSHQAYIALAQLNVGKRDYAAAAKYLREAQQIDPKDYVADYLLRIEQAALRM